jgi:hypothetical protein
VSPFDQSLNRADSVESQHISLNFPVNPTMNFLKNNSLVWRQQNQSILDDRLVFQNASSEDVLSLKQTGEVLIGQTGTHYSLPPSRGVNEQVVQSDGSGVMSFETLDRSGKYSQSSVVLVNGADGEKTIFDTASAQGSNIIPANSLNDADIYNIRATCVYEHDEKKKVGFVTRVTVGGVLIATCPETKMEAQMTEPRVCDICVQLRYFSFGSYFNTNVSVSYVDNNDEKESEKIIAVLGRGINPAIDNAIDITCEWTTTDPGETLHVRSLTISKLLI